MLTTSFLALTLYRAGANASCTVHAHGPSGAWTAQAHTSRELLTEFVESVASWPARASSLQLGETLAAAPVEAEFTLQFQRTPRGLTVAALGCTTAGGLQPITDVALEATDLEVFVADLRRVLDTDYAYAHLGKHPDAAAYTASAVRPVLRISRDALTPLNPAYPTIPLDPPLANGEIADLAHWLGSNPAPTPLATWESASSPLRLSLTSAVEEDEQSLTVFLAGIGPLWTIATTSHHLRHITATHDSIDIQAPCYPHLPA
ncbi:MAG: hypothetical protein Q4B10_03595 [Actinomycetaceae bacterium]|nr:hypothetical protein [Actinomycetaceae bacterium]